MLNLEDTTLIAKLSPEHISNLCVLATEAGVALPTKFINAVYTRIYEDKRPWDEITKDFDPVLFEVLEWQERMTDQWQ